MSLQDGWSNDNVVVFVNELLFANSADTNNPPTILYLCLTLLMAS